MKLVALMCVEEHVVDARNLLKKQNLSGFSELPMKGYKASIEDESTNWFASKHVLDNSHMFFTMCDEETAKDVMKAIETCSLSKQKNSVHAFQLNIENFVG